MMSVIIEIWLVHFKMFGLGMYIQFPSNRLSNDVNPLICVMSCQSVVPMTSSSHKMLLYILYYEQRNLHPHWEHFFQSFEYS